LYLFKQGYSSEQIGVLSATKPLAGAIAGNLLCSLADAIRRHRCGSYSMERRQLDSFARNIRNLANLKVQKQVTLPF
jgi:hypothetical protein